MIIAEALRRRGGLIRQKHVALAAAWVVLPAALAATVLPLVAARALLHPVRSARKVPTPAGCVERTFAADVSLSGWFCRSTTPQRGSLIILHGVADTRAGAAGLVSRFAARGFDVVAYDSRAHGESGGDGCTYGFWEKQDLRRVIGTLRAGPVVLLGTSLGAGVALQVAAGDPRVTGVVAVEVFSDLETIARDRAPWFVPNWMIQRAFRTAERLAAFRVADVSPVRAAGSITVPVLLIHGAADTNTPPNHSKRVYDALRGPKRLMLVEGARHNESLRNPAVWAEITDWIAELLSR